MHTYFLLNTPLPSTHADSSHMPTCSPAHHSQNCALSPQDKNPDAGERFSEIAAAYAVLSDPRKRQIYDQLGDQGVQMVDNMSQQGLPDWILNPAVQRFGLLLLLFLALNFAVLMPLFILMRADSETGWPWPVVLVPV